MLPLPSWPKTLPLPCVSTAFAATGKPPFLAVPSQVTSRPSCPGSSTPRARRRGEPMFKPNWQRTRLHHGRCWFCALHGPPSCRTDGVAVIGVATAGALAGVGRFSLFTRRRCLSRTAVERCMFQIRPACALIEKSLPKPHNVALSLACRWPVHKGRMSARQMCFLQQKSTSATKKKVFLQQKRRGHLQQVADAAA